LRKKEDENFDEVTHDKLRSHSILEKKQSNFRYRYQSHVTPQRRKSNFGHRYQSHLAYQGIQSNLGFPIYQFIPNLELLKFVYLKEQDQPTLWLLVIYDSNLLPKVL